MLEGHFGTARRNQLAIPNASDSRRSAIVQMRAASCGNVQHRRPDLRFSVYRASARVVG